MKFRFYHNKHKKEKKLRSHEDFEREYVNTLEGMLEVIHSMIKPDKADASQRIEDNRMALQMEYKKMRGYFYTPCGKWDTYLRNI